MIHSRLLKIGFFFIILFVSSYSIFSEVETQLEKIWESATSKNDEIVGILHEMDIVDISCDFSNSIYDPILKVEASNIKAPDSQKRDDGEIYDYSTASIIFSKAFTGGSVFSSAIKHKIERLISAWGPAVIQSPEISLSLEQNLVPWWIQGEQKDPQQRLLEAQFNYLKAREKEIKKRILAQLTLNYLAIRENNRSIYLLEKTISLDSLILENLQKMYDEGSVKYNEIIKHNQKMMDRKVDILELREEQTILCKSIYDLSGYRMNIAIEEPLPTLLKQSDFTPDYIIQPEWLLLTSQIETVELERINRRQLYSPKISIELNLSWPLDNKLETDWKDAWTDAWDNRMAPQYELCIGLDLSYFLSHSNKKESIQEKIRIKFLNEQKVNFIQEQSHELEVLNIRIKSIEKQESLITSLLDDTKSNYNDIFQLHEQGAISDIELIDVSIMLQKRKNDLDNTQELLWLYRSFYPLLLNGEILD